MKLSADADVTLGLGIAEGIEKGLALLASRLGAGVGDDRHIHHAHLPGARRRRKL